MVIKVKEITIGRGRKWAWDFGNSVGYNISVTIEGTTAKDTVEEMRRVGMNELLVLQDNEQERCRDVYDIAELQNGMEYKESLEKAQQSTSSGHPVEKLETKPDPKVSKAGKYTWYPLHGGGKVRKCNNEGCDLFLKYSEEKSTYEHWKYDANTGVGVYAQDRCDYY